MEGIDRALLLPEEKREEALNALQDRVRQANADTLFTKQELDWEADSGLRISATLLRTMVAGFVAEADHGLHRLFGSYDTAVFGGERIPLQAMTMEAFEELNSVH
jgi:hypothetical protein